MSSEEKKPRSMADIARSVSQLEDAPTKEEILAAADQARRDPDGIEPDETDGMTDTEGQDQGENTFVKRTPQGVDRLVREDAYPEPADAIPSGEKTEEPEGPFDPDAVPGVRFSVEPKKASTFRFLVRHSMTRVSGWVVLAVGVLMIALPFFSSAENIRNQRMLYVVLGVAMIVLPYVMMYRTAIKQERRLAGKPVLYILNDRELTSVSGDQHGSLEWKQVYRLIETKDSFFLYMDKSHAVVWPTDQMGDAAVAELRRIAPQAMEPGRARFKEEQK